MKITQFGLCYSPNLGDGVIAECLAHGLRTRHPGAQVRHVDLSGRDGFGAVTVRNRETLLAILDRLPQFIRQPLVLWRLNRLVDGVEGEWRAAAQADLAVIGGGQILSDAHLNFPIKIGRAARLLAEAGTPTALYAVGVSQNWSRRGAELFRALLSTDLRLVAPRDGNAAQAWRAQVPDGPEPSVIPDPGLLAAETYGTQQAAPDLIGLCVTDFGLLGHHADSPVAGSGADPAGFYVGITQALIAQGHRVSLFTNGAAEDRRLRAAVVAALGDMPGLEAPEDPTRPSDLVAQIAGCAGIIAHRLHACIVGYSYGRPIVGLGWDRKLQSFFELSGQGAFFVGDSDTDAKAVATLMRRALSDGLDQPQREAVMDQAWAGIDRLLACANQPAVT